MIDELSRDPWILQMLFDERGVLLVDFLCASTGGPMYYTGRDMKTSHRGMKISEGDWAIFLGHAGATLDAFRVPPAERQEVVAFVLSLKSDIVEA